jgi:hypothetical protein
MNVRRALLIGAMLGVASASAELLTWRQIQCDWVGSYHEAQIGAGVVNGFFWQEGESDFASNIPLRVSHLYLAHHEQFAYLSIC